MTTRIIDVLLNTTMAQAQIQSLNSQLVTVNSTASNISRALGAGAAIVGVTALTVAYTKLVDEINIAAARIRALTNSEEELAEIQKELIKLSQETGTSLKSNADVFSILGNAVKGTGISTFELVEITGTLNKAFTVSGATADGARNALRQLGQGLSSGALRGEEFNSVAEQAPVILDLLASSLDMAKGDLRAFAATGGITSEVIINAVEKGATKIDDAFSKMPPTLDRINEKAGTAFSKLIKNVEDSTQFGKKFLVVYNDIVEATDKALTKLTEKEKKYANQVELLTKKQQAYFKILDAEKKGNANRADSERGELLRKQIDDLSKSIRAYEKINQEKSKEIRLNVANKTLLDAQIENNRKLKKLQDESNKELLNNLIIASSKKSEAVKSEEADLKLLLSKYKESRDEQLKLAKAQIDKVKDISEKDSKEYIELLNKSNQSIAEINSTHNALIEQATQESQEKITEIQIAEDKRRSDESARETTRRAAAEAEIRRKAEEDFGYKKSTESEDIIDSVSSDEDTSEAEKLAEKYLIAEQMLQANADVENEINKQRFEQDLINEAKYLEKKAALKSEFDENTKSLSKAAADAKNNIEKGQLMSALSIFSSGSKKLFKLKKALAMSEIAIAIPTAVAEAVKNAGGLPMGLPAGIATGLYGLAQLKQVSSQQYGGGGGGAAGAVASGGGGGGASAPQPQSRVSQQGQNSTPTRDITTITTSDNREILQELRDMDSEFIPTSTARKMAAALSSVQDESGIPTQGFND